MKKLSVILLGVFGLLFSSNVFALDNTADISEINSSFMVRNQITNFSNLSHFTYDDFIFSDDMYYNDLWSGGVYKLGFINYQSNYIPLVDSYNLNFYFPNPCGQGEPITYDIKLRFYGNDVINEFAYGNLNIISQFSECSGSFSVFESNYGEYDLTCSFRNPSYVLASLNFVYNSARFYNFINYRIAIQRNFSYVCSINTDAIIQTINNNFVNLERIRLEEQYKKIGSSPTDFFSTLSQVDSLGDTDFFETNRSIPINTNSSNFIWGSFDTFLHSHPLLVTTFTSLLLLGFLKFVFVR